MPAPRLSIDFTRVNPGTMKRGDSFPMMSRKVQTWADATALYIDALQLLPIDADAEVFYGEGPPSSSIAATAGDVYIDVSTGDVFTF